MPLILYIKCFILGILGMTISTLLILNSLSKKAKAANVIFKPTTYFNDDKFLIIGNFLWILVVMMLLDFIAGWKPDWEKFFLPGFFLMGWVGCDLASRLVSVANKRINSAIDYKTTISDTQTGTLDNPTPTTKP